MEATAKFVEAIEKQNFSSAQKNLSQAIQDIIEQKVEAEKAQVRAIYSDEV
jgi:hypothetical protein